MKIPAATKTSAILSGASIAVIAAGLSYLKNRGYIPFDVDSPEVTPFVILYFFTTAIIFVVGVDAIAPKLLKTRWPGIYFPTDRAGMAFMFSVWGRMVLWFIGAAASMEALRPLLESSK